MHSAGHITSCYCRYEVLQCGGVEKLIKKRKNKDEAPVYYVSIEDTYNVVKKAHLATAHGGRDRMLKKLSAQYANITRETVELFKSHCPECQEKQKWKGVIINPILACEYPSRG